MREDFTRENIRRDSVRQDSVRQDSVRQESVHQESVSQDSIYQESIRDTALRLGYIDARPVTGHPFDVWRDRLSSIPLGQYLSFEHDPAKVSGWPPEEITIWVAIAPTPPVTGWPDGCGMIGSYYMYAPQRNARRTAWEDAVIAQGYDVKRRAFLPERAAAIRAGLGVHSLNGPLIAPVYGSFVDITVLMIHAAPPSDARGPEHDLSPGCVGFAGRRAGGGHGADSANRAEDGSGADSGSRADDGYDITRDHGATHDHCAGSDAATHDHCAGSDAATGSCSECIKSCPTGAISEDGVNTLICLRSYMNRLEDLPEADFAKMGRMILGCDICQLACPHNRSLKHTSPPDDIAESMKLENLLTKPDVDLISRYPKQGEAYIKTMAALAAANTGRKDLLPLVEALIGGEDEVLDKAAKWAAERLR